MGFEVRNAADSTVIVLSGDLDVYNSGELYDALQEVFQTSSGPVILDFERLGRLDPAGIAVISLATSEFESAQRALHARNLSESHERALAMMPARVPLEEPAGADESVFERVGDRGLVAWQAALELLELVYDTLRMAWLVLRGKRKAPWSATIEQSVLIGADAVLIVCLLSFLLGLIIAFQSAWQLREFGANIYVANLVGISMTREFGPMMTAIMLAGRTGSAIAAELGTMKVSEEIDALHVMGIEPVRFLVLPRLAALTVVQPALTLMADFVGIAGGFVIGVLMLDLSTNVYLEQTIGAVGLDDFSHGVLKSFVFAWIIGITACYSGLKIEGGAAGVGRATTKSVVTSIFLIIVADSIFAVGSTYLTERL